MTNDLAALDAPYLQYFSLEMPILVQLVNGITSGVGHKISAIAYTAHLA